jgi:PKD repeat protein
VAARLGHLPRRRPASIVVGILAAAVLAAGIVVLQPSGVTGAVGDIGLEGPAYSGAGAEPAGSKPESKLWWHGRFWWGSLWAASGEHHIFRLDPTSQNWTDTGVVIDGRSNTRSDVLWDGRKLYVASHVYGERASPGHEARLYRYSYDPARRRYSLDAGFPATINDYATETLVIDKDSSGRVWATWVQDGSVYVSHTVDDDRRWATPFALPASGARGLHTDDISALVAFGGSKIGVMWSNQRSGSFSFAVHLDGQPPSSWAPVEIALGGPRNADDHINLKATRDGRVFAAVRTLQRAATAPQVLLLARTPTGTWSRHTFGTVADRHGRAILVLDEGSERAHVFATSAENNGTVYRKDASLRAPQFAAGVGTPILRSLESATMNNPTSTKQSVSGKTGAVVLGGLASTNRYWHNTLRLPARKEPALEADLAGSPTSGFAPLTVAFSDRSGAPVAGRTWNFGDGSPVSTRANPVHTYETPGSYTVTLTVWDGNGAESAYTRAAYITVLPLVASFSASATAGRVPLFVSFADTSSGPVVNRLWDFGDGRTSTAANPTHGYRSAGLFTVRLTVTDTAGNSATSTKAAYVNALPLTAGFTAAPKDGPAPLGVRFADHTLGTPSQWFWDFGDGATSASRNPAHEYTEPGTYSVALTVKDAAGNTSTRTQAAYVSVVPLTADFVGTPTVGPTPLTVAFVDRSSGRATRRVWDFGDGTTASEELRPTHIYRRPGAYTVKLTVHGANGETSTKTRTSYVTATSDIVIRPLVHEQGRLAGRRHSLVAFDVPTLPGTLISAKLRLFVVEARMSGGHIYAVAGADREDIPAIAGGPLGTVARAPVGTWAETALPLGTFATGPGRYSFALTEPVPPGKPKPQLVLTVDYGPENAPPHALGDSASTDEDSRVVVDVLANDDPGLPEEADQSLRLDAITTAPLYGSASIADGRISYVPRAEYSGHDALAYRVCDNGADPLCSTARLDLSVLPVNDPPRAAEDAIAGNEDVAMVLGLIANDMAGPPNEADQTPSVEALTVPPQHGHAEIVAGKMVYTPAHDYNGTDTLGYRVCDDGRPRLCAESMVSLSLASVNDAPRAAADSAVIDEDVTTLVAVLANDNGGAADEAGEGLRIHGIVSAPSSGAVSVEKDGVRYTPALDFHGRDSFTYRVCDAGDAALCSTGIVQIDVLSVNDLPAARDDLGVVDEDSSVAIDALANDDPGERGQTIRLENLLAAPSHGTAKVALGRVVYTPAQDYSGPDRLAYRACDDGTPRFCVEAEVSLTAIAVNDAPRPKRDSAVVHEDTPQLIPVLANDEAGPADEGTEGLWIDGIVRQPRHGKASVGGGRVRYTPAAEFSGRDRFTYRVCDGGEPSACGTARVSVVVAKLNDRPALRSDAVAGTASKRVSVDVLANDGPGAGETPQRVRLVRVVWGPAHGSAVVARGRILYRARVGHKGFDSLVYKVCDNGVPVRCSSATLAIRLFPGPRLLFGEHTGAIRFRRGRFSGRAASRGPRSAS